MPKDSTAPLMERPDAAPEGDTAREHPTAPLAGRRNPEIAQGVAALVIRSAADAIAASHCLLARQATSPQGIARADHNRECSYCGWTLAELIAAVDDFWEWEGSAHAVEVWECMGPVLQIRHVEEAQGYREPRTIGPQER